MKQEDVAKCLDCNDPENLYKILDFIPEGVMILDNDFKIKFANKAILDLHFVTDISQDNVTGKFCYDVTHHLEGPCAPPDHACPIEEYRKTGEVAKVIHKHFDKDGKQFLTEVTAYPIKDESGDVSGFIHIANGLSENIKRDLEDLNKVMTMTFGREARMTELKAKIKELEKKVEESSKE